MDTLTRNYGPGGDITSEPLGDFGGKAAAGTTASHHGRIRGRGWWGLSVTKGGAITV